MPLHSAQFGLIVVPWREMLWPTGRSRQKFLDSGVLQKQIEHEVIGTCFHEVGETLTKLIQGTRGTDGTWGSIESQAALGRVEYILHRLPQAYGTRFVFDTQMVKAIASEWRKAPHPLSDAVIPI
jgi:hypothetical protein